MARSVNLEPFDDLSRLPVLPPPRMNLIGQGTKAVRPSAARLPMMAPTVPTPADLFGPAPLPYRSDFYENTGFRPTFTPLTPQERWMERQQDPQQNRREVNLQGGGGSNTLAGGGGETLTMGPNEEAVSSSNYSTPVGTTPVWQVPFSGGRTNSRSFGGPRSSGRHAGVDIPAPIGSPVYAIDNGTVVGRWTSSSGYGNIVDVEYPDGTVHRFAHLSDGAPLAVGTKVQPGTVVGYAGVSGNANSRFQHVHHEVIEKAHYYAGEAVKDRAENVIGRRFYGRETAGREDPRLYYMGYKGPNAVAEFQQAAKQAGVYTGEIDGKDGPLTQLAIANGGTQLARNAPASGINPETAQSAIASLADPSGGTLVPSIPAGTEAYAPFLPPPSPGQAAISDLILPPSTTSDRDKLAGVMLAEARGEGRNGMAGVGNVVLNRQAAEGNRFPKTINEVINNEFAKPLGPNDVSPDEWAEATQTATQLLDGTIPDNTGGAVYFANTATSKPSLYAEIANSGPVSATIGNHTFHTDAKIGAVSRGTGDLTADQIDELTRTDTAGNYTNPLVASPAPEAARRPGPGGALGVDLGQMPAGMPPPPSRPGTFDWLGGGAPPAAMVPPPGISPLRPAFGGPGDGRPQPPIPPYNPRRDPYGFPIDVNRPAIQNPDGSISTERSVTFDAAEVGLPPEIVTVPTIINGRQVSEQEARRLFAAGQNPPLQRGFSSFEEADRAAEARTRSIPAARATADYPAASMANMPATVGMPPSVAPGPVGAFSPSGTPSDLVPFLPPPAASVAPAIAPPLERAGRRIAGGGQGGPVIPITPDEMRSSLANANANTEMSLGLGGLGTPETAMSLARTYPPPLSGMDERMDRAFSEAQSRGLARELGFNRRQMEGYTAPPPSPFAEARTKDDPYALPGPVAGFDRAARASQIMGLPPDLNVGAFPPSPAEDPYAQQRMSSFDTSRPYSGFTPPPRYADLPSISGGGGSDVLGASPEEPASPSWATGMDQYRPMLPLPPIPGTRFLPSDADPNNITLPTEPTDIRPAAQVDAEQAPTIDPVVADANMPVVPQPAPRQKVAAAATAPPTKTAEEEKKRNSFLSRLLPGGGNGFLGNFLGSFGTPPNFTAYANPIMNTGMGGTIRTSGKTPSGTPWSTGTSNALGGSNALRWTGSNGQTITAYTDPQTGQTFHSFS